MGKFVKFTDKAGEWRFNLKAGNGEKILHSEGYKSESGCDNGIESVRTNSQDDSKYVDLEATSGQLHFNLKASNGQVIGTSEMYTSAGGRTNGKASVKKNAPDAEVENA
ncbi:MAG: hypothetical protein ACI9P5_001691 [Saprospiraceae bacterium]|jgi:uncharacterized protein YegP (UPF0339 family)